MKLAIAIASSIALTTLALDSEAGGRGGGGGGRGGHHASGGHHHHKHPVRGGFYFWPRTYWGPGYYYPVVPVTEPYWYYCAESAAYYPHVQDCPSGWQPVRPASPPPLG